jgi:hypothetical protein
MAAKHFLRTLAIVAGCSIAALGAATPSQARTHFTFSGNFNFGGPAWGGGYYGGPYYGYRAPIYAPAYRYRPYGYGRPYYWGPGLSAGVVFNLFPPYVYDRVDLHARDVYYGAYRRSLEAPVGDTIVWSEGGVQGGVTTTRDGWAGERYCREFRQDITIDGRTQEAYGTACRSPDGDWQLVPNQP